MTNDKPTTVTLFDGGLTIERCSLSITSSGISIRVCTTRNTDQMDRIMTYHIPADTSKLVSPSDAPSPEQITKLKEEMHPWVKEMVAYEVMAADLKRWLRGMAFVVNEEATRD